MSDRMMTVGMTTARPHGAHRGPQECLIYFIYVLVIGLFSALFKKKVNNFFWVMFYKDPLLPKKRNQMMAKIGDNLLIVL